MDTVTTPVQAKTWDDETVAELRRLWDLGLSAAKIAQALGFESRNIVCGKAHRLGLSKGKGATVGVRVREAAPPPRNAVRDTRETPVPPPPVPAPVPERAVRVTVPPPPPRTVTPQPVEGTALLALFDLRPDTCRWPVGDPARPGFGFCGRTSGTGPYCAAHAALAYEPQRPRAQRVVTR